jgi:hypothetical protein
VKNRLSFRGLIFLLFVGALIPLLVMVGLLVYRLQQAYLLNEAQTHLIDFVRAGVEQYASDTDLTILAVNLGENLRVFGADMFIQDADGNPYHPRLAQVPGSMLITRLWDCDSMQMIGSGRLLNCLPGGGINQTFAQKRRSSRPARDQQCLRQRPIFTHLSVFGCLHRLYQL